MLVPPVAVPEPIEIEPDDPAVAVPERNARSPLMPVSPELADAIVIKPLVLAIPCPLVMLTVPPVRCVLRPADTTIRPPIPLLPLPTVTLTAPALPVVDAALPIDIEPLVPDDALPELKDSKPETPL